MGVCIPASVHLGVCGGILMLDASQHAVLLGHACCRRGAMAFLSHGRSGEGGVTAPIGFMQTYRNCRSYKDTKRALFQASCMEEGGSRSQGVALPVEEAEEPSLTRGPATQSPILCSSMWKMAGEQEEEGKEVVWRKEEEEGGGQLVGSANRYGNSHLIDM